MEPIPEIFKGKVVCKCCMRAPVSNPSPRQIRSFRSAIKNISRPTQNIHLIIREKTEKKKLIININ